MSTFIGMLRQVSAHQQVCRSAPNTLRCHRVSFPRAFSETATKRPAVVELDYEQLVKMTPRALGALTEAFVGSKAFGAIAVINVPGYREARERAFRAGIDLALKDDKGRITAAAVNNTYPGWSGTPGTETHPLQSSFLYNVKEAITGGKVDPYFGKNVFPNAGFKDAFTNIANPMHEVALHVLRGCDLIVEVNLRAEGQQWTEAGRSVHRLGLEGPALAGRFICYDSGFTREDKMLETREVQECDVLPPNDEKFGDGLASVQTSATPVKSAGHAGDGLASMRTHATPVKSAGGDGSRRTQSAGLAADVFVTASRPADGHMARHAHTQARETPNASADDVGDYWLPWHIDSNFVTLLHREMYAREEDAVIVPEPEGAGILAMNKDGDVVKFAPRDDAMILQMGAFAQIYSGGVLTACRHAVRNPMPPGVARFNYCNFWYVPWDTACTAPEGREHLAVSTGWNAMMDDSYLNITMRQSFHAFRKFMTSPEARLQFRDSELFLELSEMFPVPVADAGVAGATPKAEVVIDVLTDVRCPISYISTLRLDQALKSADLSDRAIIRYHPIFLNPNVPAEGENLDEYLQREFGYTKEYAHADDYPLRLQGLEVGVNMNPNRRVVNTFAASCLLAIAEEAGKQREAFSALSRRYFESAEDISDLTVLLDIADSVGLDLQKVRQISLPTSAVCAQVSETYAALSSRVGEVPHFVLRERLSGNGLDVSGNRSVAEFSQVLDTVLEKARQLGMTIPGVGGDLWLPEAVPTAPVSLAYRARHGWSAATPAFSPDDFSRMDESPDTQQYATPRLVQHLDVDSLKRLTGVFRCAFAAVPPGFAVLDLCSSWVSHFPQELLTGARVAVHGLNAAELDANEQATERHVQDLNSDVRLPWEDGTFDFVTMSLSVQYLTKPLDVFAEMNRVLRPGGMALVAFSHRCFIEKCVRKWATEPDDGEGHAHLVTSYFEFSSPEWEGFSTVDVSPKHGDPLWLVTAIRSG